MHGSEAAKTSNLANTASHWGL